MNFLCKNGADAKHFAEYFIYIYIYIYIIYVVFIILQPNKFVKKNIEILMKKKKIYIYIYIYIYFTTEYWNI